VRPAAVLLLGALGASACVRDPAPAPPPQTALVDLHTVAPSIRLDIRYATPNNFTGRALYPAPRCLLRPDVAQRLARAQARLEAMQLGLQVYDCYRPLSVQRELWALMPDERYVADPAKGSRHNRGAAVDVTLVDASGNELTMPTGFDDFSERAHRTYSALPPVARANRALLEHVMADAGFEPLPTEWWHFDAQDWQAYEVLDVPLPTGPPAAR
jgi:beta-N-acetylhexosaminidase/D-alanyl-D-alanine dipeptidase